eukprot:765852-Hanusia_phi.AAC.8
MFGKFSESAELRWKSAAHTFHPPPDRERVQKQKAAPTSPGGPKAQEKQKEESPQYAELGISAKRERERGESVRQPQGGRVPPRCQVIRGVDPVIRRKNVRGIGVEGLGTQSQGSSEKLTTGHRRFGEQYRQQLIQIHLYSDMHSAYTTEGSCRRTVLRARERKTAVLATKGEFLYAQLSSRLGAARSV